MSTERKKTKSEIILNEVKKRKAKQEIVDVEEEKIKLVIFSLENNQFAFNADDVKEILLVDKITYVPGSPDFILGIINVRGDIESVLDLHKFIGLANGKVTNNSRIVLLENEEIRSGILVDSVDEVLDFPKSGIHDPISSLSSDMRELVMGETTYKEKIITIFNIGSIFNKIKND